MRDKRTPKDVCGEAMLLPVVLVVNKDTENDRKLQEKVLLSRQRPAEWTCTLTCVQAKSI